MSGTFPHDRVVDYDASLVKGKEKLIEDYEAVVRHNMEELTERFRIALELDLICADDFEVACG
jgi:hypothetical protein